MTKQALLIGLGRFGMSLARSLAERGVEVLAVDASAKRVEEAADVVSRPPSSMRPMRTSSAAHNPPRATFASAPSGTSRTRPPSFCTALLRQLGARVWSRAPTPNCMRASCTWSARTGDPAPRGSGNVLLTRSSTERLPGGRLPLGTRSSWPVEAKTEFVGKTLAELRLPGKYGVTVVATRSLKGSGVRLPSGTQIIEDKDVLVVVSSARR
ncbi:MAG: TrkA C-terminal domain-containing protein [Bryobacterales bacterium]